MGALRVARRRVERPQPLSRVRREAWNQALVAASGRCRDRAPAVIAPGLVAVRQSGAGDAEGERDRSGDGEKVLLQKNLPADFAGKIRARVASDFAGRGPRLEGDGSDRPSL